MGGDVWDKTLFLSRDGSFSKIGAYRDALSDPFTRLLVSEEASLSPGLPCLCAVSGLHREPDAAYCLHL